MSNNVEENSEQRTVFFIQETVKENGQYVPCIAEEGSKGYYKTDWLWGSDKEMADKMCDERNEKSGISKEEAMKIVARSMF